MRTPKVFKKCLHKECERHAISRGHCDKHYRRILRNGSADAVTRVVRNGMTAKEKFNLSYNVIDTGCWIWTGGSRPNGKGVPYPRLWGDNRKALSAHRFSYELFNGPIEAGLYVCHRCDTPLCVNPQHLFLGTHKENMADMRQKNRSYRGRGEEKGTSILTNNQAREIRESNEKRSVLAKRFGVSITTIRRIQSGETYNV